MCDKAVDMGKIKLTQTLDKPLVEPEQKEDIAKSTISMTATRTSTNSLISPNTSTAETGPSFRATMPLNS